MSPLYLILFIGGGLYFILLVVGLIVTITSEQSLVDERLKIYTDEQSIKEAKKEQERSTPVGDWVNLRLERSNWGANLSRDLARADLKFKPGEYVALIIITGIAVAALCWAIGGQNLVFTMIGAIIGSAIPRYFVRRKQAQRLTNFNNQLADMLNLMVNGLRAGYSTMQAMEAIGREMPAPISVEFHRVVQEMQLGIPMEVALDNLLRRIPSDDLDLIVAAMNVQREIGGNLAEILDTISHTIRERVRIKGEIRVLVTQVMYSGRFLSVLPIVISLVLWIINRPYMMQFFNPDTRIFGITMLVIGALMILAGYYVMTRIANIEV
jgi:tight adherence protein B